MRRFVPRRPGLLAAFGHRPRLLPLCPRQTPAGRRTADARSGRRLPQRHAPRRNRHDAGHRQRTADAPRRGGPHARRTHAPPPPQRSRNDVRSRRPEAVERRSPEPLHAHGRGPRRRRFGDRSRGVPRGIPQGRDPRRAAVSQRQTDPHQRCQPARNGAEHGLLCHARRDGARHPRDETPQHERRAHVPLPRHAAVVRPLRRIRSLRRGRSQRRIARLPLPRQVEEPRRQPRLRRRAPRPQPPHGAARLQPPLDHRLEHGKRGRKRPQLRTLLRLDQGLRPVAPRAIRAGLLPRRLQHRHRLPDVLELRAV